jgi:hypothetical protein
MKILPKVSTKLQQRLKAINPPCNLQIKTLGIHAIQAKMKDNITAQKQRTKVPSMR